LEEERTAAQIMLPPLPLFRDIPPRLFLRSS